MGERVPDLLPEGFVLLQANELFFVWELFMIGITGDQAVFGGLDDLSSFFADQFIMETSVKIGPDIFHGGLCFTLFPYPEEDLGYAVLCQIAIAGKFNAVVDQANIECVINDKQCVLVTIL